MNDVYIPKTTDEIIQDIKDFLDHMCELQIADTETELKRYYGEVRFNRMFGLKD